VSYVKLLSGRLTRATRGSAAFDLYYAGEIPLYLGPDPLPIRTGVRTQFSRDLVAVIKEKSGLALGGLSVGGGVIDSDFSDEWKVILCYPSGNPNCDSDRIKIEPGQKIAQVLFLQLPEIHLDGDGWELGDGDRVGGFGSTGK
jgi:dUTP pyrophosphatase